MKTLCLFRHAKSSWEEPLDDRDRPLAPRGRRAAPAMAEHMQAGALVPDRVLCSPAERTRETWALMATTLGIGLPVSYRDEVYGEGPDGLLELIRGVDDVVEKLMVIGHNPTLEILAERLIGRGPERLRKRLQKKYPTAALAVIELPVERWHDVAPGTGTLAEFTRPKDLPEADEKRL